MAYINLDDPLEPEDYDLVADMVAIGRITHGRLLLLMEENPDFANWYTWQASDMELADVG